MSESKTFVVQEPESDWYVSKLFPLLWFHVTKYLVLSPTMQGPFGPMRMRGWVYLKRNATAFKTRKEAGRAMRMRNNETIVEEKRR